ncbi:MAG: sigma-70 family RNA polymerase sigma factor [Clostridia bacterium]|nr:sigma-70 family RNA polymerase sigma factor [Clostridia bacterium]
MNINDVVSLLEKYPSIDDEINMYRKVLSDLLDTYKRSIGTVKFDSQPKAKVKNNAESVVENTVVNMPENIKDDIDICNNLIGELQSLKTETLKEVSRLEYYQKKVVFNFYFYNMKWKDISKQLGYTDRQCRNIRDRALISLLPVFERNKIIIAYINN